jgi:hypothetical protein
VFFIIQIPYHVNSSGSRSKKRERERIYFFIHMALLVAAAAVDSIGRQTTKMFTFYVLDIYVCLAMIEMSVLHNALSSHCTYIMRNAQYNQFYASFAPVKISHLRCNAARLSFSSLSDQHWIAMCF